MTDILVESTPSEMIEANQRNLLNFFLMTSKSSKGIYYFDQNGIEGLNSFIPVSILNRIIKTNTTAKNLEDKFDYIKKMYHDKNIPMYWEIWSNSLPSNIREILQEYGFKYDSEFPAMVLEHTQIPENKSISLNIKKVDNEDEAIILADLFSEIYGVPEPARDGFLNTVLSTGFDINSKLVNYIGYEDEKPVCISSVYYDSGVVGIYNVGTIEGYNRKGYGTEITLFPLMEAKENGYKYMMLQSSEQGLKVYHRMGFKVLSRVETFKLEP
ncbi:GNAT family N-acetyltransferase [Aquibacillus halophilus]|uniref:GNAT family N-acetyltransferase n=1 Tax=Aquibacillus halophilus TaxID=930132 RepID=A0A6A8DGP9_9BACI|nr:GNAT family N-acetyltransferase [Aquibacillus halophilus]MRH42067.1 GNAT family N-acetyltransferase [Aquibacillus halophilus]